MEGHLEKVRRWWVSMTIGQEVKGHKERASA